MSHLPIKTYFTLTGPDGAQLTLFTLADLSFGGLKSVGRPSEFAIYVDHGPGYGDSPLPGVVGYGRACWIRDAIMAIGQGKQREVTTCRGDTITLAAATRATRYAPGNTALRYGHPGQALTAY